MKFADSAQMHETYARRGNVSLMHEKKNNHVLQRQQQLKQQHNYMQIGRPIPASSWSRDLQFAGRDTTFVHVVTPMLRATGDVSMMMCRKRTLVGWRKQCTLHKTILVRV